MFLGSIRLDVPKDSHESKTYFRWKREAEAIGSNTNHYCEPGNSASPVLNAIVRTKQRTVTLAWAKSTYSYKNLCVSVKFTHSIGWRPRHLPRAYSVDETIERVCGMQSIVNSRYFFWIILAIPSIPMTRLLSRGVAPIPDLSVYEFLLHPTGEFAARFMIIAMMLTPLRMLMPKVRFWTWMIQRRRYLGVAAFLYAFAHTVFYLIDRATLDVIFGEWGALGIWTGWLAFFIFLPLAITSNDYSVRKLGRGWKRLQQFVYAAAIATLLHWMFVHNEFGPAIVHFTPLALLELYRIVSLARRRSATAN